MKSTSDFALEVRGLTVSFLRVRGLVGILLLIPFIAWLVSCFRRFRPYLDRQIIIDDLEFRVKQNSIHGLFGVNGAGKSCLLRALCGLEPPDAGEIVLFGENCSTKTAKQLATVMSRANRELAADFTVIEIIEMTARLFQLDPAVAVEGAKKLLVSLGVAEADLEKHPGDISVGTKGKVVVVRALIPLLAHTEDRRGCVLLLDEPTIGFDPVAVEQFFAAVRALREMMPELSIIVATNDPREMSLCDDFTAIIGGKPAHNEEAFTRLRDSMPAYRSAILAAAELIGRPIENGDGAPAATRPDLPTIPRVNARPESALVWRHWRDTFKNKAANLMVVASMVVPNLVAAFAAGQGAWQSLVLGTLGVFATLLARDAYRFLDRERGYYNMLDTILTSPLSRLGHFLSVARLAIITQLGYTALFAMFFALILGGGGAGLAQANGQAVLRNLPGVCCVTLGVIILAYAIGIVTALIPFVMRSQIATYFFLSLVPMLMILCSGAYYDVSRLPPGLSHLAHVNPLTYATAALAHFLELPRNTVPAITGWVCALLPGISAGWANVLVMFAFGLPGLAISAGIYWMIEPLLRRAGRLRSAG